MRCKFGTNVDNKQKEESTEKTHFFWFLCVLTDFCFSCGFVVFPQQKQTQIFDNTNYS